MRLSFHCAFGRGDAPVCDRAKPWKADATVRYSPASGEPESLLVTNEAAACPGCGNTGTAESDELVIVGQEG